MLKVSTKSKNEKKKKKKKKEKRKDIGEPKELRWS